MAQQAHTWTQGGLPAIFIKLRKPGLELETLGSDTMLSMLH